VDSPIEPPIGIVGIGGNSDYLNSHKDVSPSDLQAPYLNSMAGKS
jgi:hypothetical protein